MYYDALRRRVMAAKKYQQAMTTSRADILNSIATAEDLQSQVLYRWKL